MCTSDFPNILCKASLDCLQYTIFQYLFFARDLSFFSPKADISIDKWVALSICGLVVIVYQNSYTIDCMFCQTTSSLDIINPVTLDKFC